MHRGVTGAAIASALAAVALIIPQAGAASPGAPPSIKASLNSIGPQDGGAVARRGRDRWLQKQPLPLH